MTNEHGNMDEVALDFCDWYAIRRWRLYLKTLEIRAELTTILNYRIYKESEKLFGHDNFLRITHAL